MATRDEILSELAENRQLIKNNSIGDEEAHRILLKYSSWLNNTGIYPSSPKYNSIKSFLVTFNVSNFADLTLIINNNTDAIKVLEYAGDNSLLNELKDLIKTECDFFRNTDFFISRDEKFRLYFEMMKNDNGDYIILSLTQSALFKPSRFHIMCDIIMDLIRYADISRESVFNDLFENNLVGINKCLSESGNPETEFFLFRFENISSFYKKIGLQITTELSDLITGKLKGKFGNDSAVFRITLTNYLIMIRKDMNLVADSDEIIKKVNEFQFNGIILSYRIFKIPFNSDRTVYDLFEYILNIH